MLPKRSGLPFVLHVGCAQMFVEGFFHGCPFIRKEVVKFLLVGLGLTQLGGGFPLKRKDILHWWCPYPGLVQALDVVRPFSG